MFEKYRLIYRNQSASSLANKPLGSFLNNILFIGLTALSQALDSKGAHTSFGKLPLSTEK